MNSVMLFHWAVGNAHARIHNLTYRMAYWTTKDGEASFGFPIKYVIILEWLNS